MREGEKGGKGGEMRLRVVCAGGLVLESVAFGMGGFGIPLFIMSCHGLLRNIDGGGGGDGNVRIGFLIPAVYRGERGVPNP